MIIGIVCYPTFGGSGVLATELGIELSKKGYEIHFITYNQPVKLELYSNKVHFHEVEVPNYPLFHYPPYELALSSKLVEMVKNFLYRPKEESVWVENDLVFSTGKGGNCEKVRRTFGSTLEN
mgnify:CR=1 FL=1